MNKINDILYNIWNDNIIYNIFEYKNNKKG